MDTLKAAVAAVIVIVALAGILLFVYKPQTSTQPYQQQAGSITTMTVNALLSASINTTQSQLVHVIPESGSVIYNVKDFDNDIDIVALNVNASQARQIFGIKTNSTGDLLVISNMVYPKITMPNNATIDFTFANFDSSMKCGFFLTTVNPALQQQNSPAVLYSLEAAFRGPMLSSYAPVTGEAYAYKTNISLGFFTSDYYMTSCGQNDTYGTILSSET
ncbi:MAG: hypothetical protein KGH60_04830 [Candidatus Micrarchaeota archaeon]|nr:hypothetical protein [Candidatus Micrarchaeota archaeon]